MPLLGEFSLRTDVTGCFRVSSLILVGPPGAAGKGFSLPVPFSSVLAETPPPLPSLCSCFAASVGEVRPDAGGLCDGVALDPPISTVREETGVSIAGSRSGWGDSSDSCLSLCGSDIRDRVCDNDVYPHICVQGWV